MFQAFCLESARQLGSLIFEKYHPSKTSVIPAKAGIQSVVNLTYHFYRITMGWVPASAGTTGYELWKSLRCANQLALALDRAVPNVFAKLHAVEANAVEGFIRTTLRNLDRVTQSCDAKYASAVGDDVAAM